VDGEDPRCSGTSLLLLVFAWDSYGCGSRMFFTKNGRFCSVPSRLAETHLERSLARGQGSRPRIIDQQHRSCLFLHPSLLRSHVTMFSSLAPCLANNYNDFPFISLSIPFFSLCNLFALSSAYPFHLFLLFSLNRSVACTSPTYTDYQLPFLSSHP